jgi:hypothetical protein
VYVDHSRLPNHAGLADDLDRLVNDYGRGLAAAWMVPEIIPETTPERAASPNPQVRALPGAD